MSPTTPIDIIVPIYGGLDELRICLESVLAHPQQSPSQLILINDCSPFPEIRDYLTTFTSQHPEVESLENPKNLGFVGTVNRGMRLHPERDLVLLNSDTEVTGDWLDRLVACAQSEPEIATVTPFSNNATICSFPRCCQDNPLPAGFSLTEIDHAFAAANSGLSVEIPTGVGFCMLIRRKALNEIGYFDEERFGKGYGEENDFCRRAVARRMKNRLCCDTFVHHSGGASFAGEKNERAEKAQEILDTLYPDYHGLIHQHITEDPQGVHRLAAWLQLLRASPRPKVLLLTHDLGGGTAKHIEELMDHLSDQAHFLLLKPLGKGRMEIDLSGHNRSVVLNFKLPDLFSDLLQLLESIGVSRIHFHHTLGLETTLWGLPQRLGVPFDITLHDYYFINGNPTQTDDNGRFTEDLELQTQPYPLQVTIAEWQQNQKSLLYQAERVIAPSRFTISIYRKHFPDAAYLAAYHPEWEESAPYPDVIHPKLAKDEPLRILVFGAISIEKGGNLLENSAKAAKERELPLEFHLIGYAYRPLEVVIEHGSYDHNRVVEQISELQPHLIWFTAQWPETYSYTLSEALASGLPIVAPDLGSFPERLRGRPLTWVEPWNQQITAWLHLFNRVRDEFTHTQHQTSDPWTNQATPHDGAHFYRHQYIIDKSTKAPSTPPLEHERLLELIELSRLTGSDHSLTSRREHLLARLIHLRHGRIGRWLSRLVPVTLQRFIKRKLSRRPIHEIL